MLRTFGKTLGSALVVLCLVSTLAVHAQEKKEEGMEMICTSSDGKGTCKSGEMNGIDVIVVGPGVKIGEENDLSPQILREPLCPRPNEEVRPCSVRASRPVAEGDARPRASPSRPARVE